MFTKALEKPARKRIPWRTQQYALPSSRNSFQRDREEFTASVPHTWPSSTKAALQTGRRGAPASTCHASAFPSLPGKLQPFSICSQSCTHHLQIPTSSSFPVSKHMVSCSQRASWWRLQPVSLRSWPGFQHHPPQRLPPVTLSIKSLAIKQEVAFRSNRTPWLKCAPGEAPPSWWAPWCYHVSSKQTDRGSWKGTADRPPCVLYHLTH